MNADARSWLTAGSFLLGAACAQEPAETPFEPAPPVAALDVGALRAGTWVYEVRRQGGRGATKEVYDLAPVGSGESREWRSASTRGTAADKWVLADTVYYAAQELRPVRRVIRILRDGVDWRIHEFSYHSTDVEVVSDYFDYRDGSPQRRPWWAGTLALPAGADPIVPAAHDAGLVHLMRLLPLRAGWAGSVHVGPFGPSGFQPSSFRVAGDETVRVPAGVFDCWRVTIGASGGRTLWISKADHLLVRSLDGPEGRGLERVLSSFTPGG
jgi:hypothetical protein